MKTIRRLSDGELLKLQKRVGSRKLGDISERRLKIYWRITNETLRRIGLNLTEAP